MDQRLATHWELVNYKQLYVVRFSFQHNICSLPPPPLVILWWLLCIFGNGFHLVGYFLHVVCHNLRVSITKQGMTCLMCHFSTFHQWDSGVYKEIKYLNMKATRRIVIDLCSRKSEMFFSPRTKWEPEAVWENRLLYFTHYRAQLNAFTFSNKIHFIIQGAYDLRQVAPLATVVRNISEQDIH